MQKNIYVASISALAFSVVGVPVVPAVPGVPEISEVPGVAVPAVPVPTVSGSEVAVPGVAVPGVPTTAAKPSIQMPRGVEIEDDGAGNVGVTAGGVQVRTDNKGKSEIQAGGVHIKTEDDGNQQIETGDVRVNSGEDEQEIEIGDMHIRLEGSTTRVFSTEALKQSIKARKQELEDELASSTPDAQSIVEDVNPVRLAVHSLLASKDLLGGIGGQVSDIAKQMNDSVASTTNAESKIQSRGFLTKLFFGGDSQAANAISQEVAQNQQRIDALTALLNQANLPAGVQSTLAEQVTALKDAQTRLQVVADSTKKQWGLFSWRFF